VDSTHRAGDAPPPAGLLRQDGELSQWSSLVAIQPGGTKPPFFCVHGIGGEIISFAELARQLGPDQPFYGLQVPTRNGVKKPWDRLEDMAAHYLEELRLVQPRGPYRLGGFSFGGLVALEMAQQLLAQGHAVALLAILDKALPGPGYRSALRAPGPVLNFLGNVPWWVREDLLRLGMSSLLARTWRKLRALGQRKAALARRGASLPAESELEGVFDLQRLPRDFREVLEAHWRAMRAYEPKVYPGRITLLRARAQPLFRLQPYDLGWGALAGGGLEVIVVPGNHESILKWPLVQALAERLQVHLRRAQGPPT
jgi:thioesterase domain-containing protein